MNIQILPNWCKKVGVLMFIVFVILSGIDGTCDAWNEYEPSEVLNPDNQNELQTTDIDTAKFSDYFGENLMHLFNILSIVGMIIYMMSKEKIEDDYIKILRLDSYQLATLLFLFTSLFVYMIFGNLSMPLDYYLELYLLLYLIIFFIKKRIY